MSVLCDGSHVKEGAAVGLVFLGMILGAIMHHYILMNKTRRVGLRYTPPPLGGHPNRNEADPSQNDEIDVFSAKQSAAKFTSKEALKKWLLENGMSAPKEWTSGCLADLYEEVSTGKSEMHYVHTVGVIRKLHIVRVKVYRDSNSVLLETNRRENGVLFRKNGLVIKRHLASEDPLECGLNAIKERLSLQSLQKFAQPGSHIPPDHVEVIGYETKSQEMQMSIHYPGLRTKYVISTLAVRMPGLPAVPFQTDSGGDLSSLTNPSAAARGTIFDQGVSMRERPSSRRRGFATSKLSLGRSTVWSGSERTPVHRDEESGTQYDGAQECRHFWQWRTPEEMDALLEKRKREVKPVVTYTRDIVSTHTKDDERRYTYVSQACADILGYTEQEMLGSPVATFFHPDQRHHAQSQAGSTFVYKLMRKDGTYVTVETAVNETEEAYIYSTRDVTERVKSEEEKERQEKAFVSYVYHEIRNPFCGIVGGVQYSLTLVQDLQQQFQQQQDQLRLQQLQIQQLQKQQLLPAASLSPNPSLFESSDPQSSSKGSGSLEIMDDRYSSNSVSSSTILAPTLKTDVSVLLALSGSEQGGVEASSGESGGEEGGGAVGVIADYARGVKTEAIIAEGGGGGGVVALQSFETELDAMLTCSNHIIGILDNVRDLAKLEQNKLQLRSVPMEVMAVVHEAAKVVRTTAHPGVDVKVMGEKLWCVGDPQRWMQVVIHLLSNALKYTTKGFVRVMVTQLERQGETSTIKLAVYDTGSGISEAVGKTLFSKYHHSGFQPGTGLGLVITKMVVELMGGTIGYESPWTTHHSGTNFFFEVPFARPPAAAERARRASLSMTMSGRRVRRKRTHTRMKDQQAGAGATMGEGGGVKNNAMARHGTAVVHASSHAPGQEMEEEPRRDVARPPAVRKAAGTKKKGRGDQRTKKGGAGGGGSKAPRNEGQARVHVTNSSLSQAPQSTTPAPFGPEPDGGGGGGAGGIEELPQPTLQGGPSPHPSRKPSVTPSSNFASRIPPSVSESDEPFSEMAATTRTSKRLLNQQGLMSPRRNSDPAKVSGILGTTLKPDGFSSYVTPASKAAFLEFIASNSDPLRGLTFLCVDDQTYNLKLLKRIFTALHPFKSLELVVETALNGEEVLERYNKGERFDVIIFDQNMQRSGGVLLGTETMVRLRELGSDALMISCSGNCSAEDFEVYLGAGAARAWPKPFPKPQAMYNDIVVALAEKQEAEGGGGGNNDKQ